MENHIQESSSTNRWTNEGLDSFFSHAPYNLADTDTLIDVYSQQSSTNNPTFEDVHSLLEKHMKVREDVLAETLETSKEPAEFEDIHNALTNAKDMFKSEISMFNQLKDSLDHKIQMKEFITGVSKETKTSFKYIHDSICKSINEDINEDKKDDTKTEENGKIEEMYNTILNMSDVYCCTILLKLEKEIDVLRNQIRDSKKRIKCMMDVFSFSKGFSIGHPCPICLGEEVRVFCEPCGHTYCSHCLRSAHCYICRAKITKVHKLFFT